MNSWITGVKENTKSKELTFYPNPVKDQIFIKFNSKEAVTIDIYNVIGSKVKTFTHDAQQSVVNLGDLQNGMYFIRFTENGITYSKSFTKSE
jgi:hypothetical protein